MCRVMYGGRITDEIDQRLMDTVGERHLADVLFEPGFEFAPGYGLPPTVPREGLLEHVVRR